MQETKQERLPDIKKIVILNAPIQKVWNAVSTSEGIANWFMPNDFKAEIGYEFTIQSPFGPSPCKVMEINPPNHLSFLWDDSGWHLSFDLKEIDGKTEFTLIHSGWGAPDVEIPKSGKNNSEIRDIMNKGWEGIVKEKLVKVVEN